MLAILGSLRIALVEQTLRIEFVSQFLPVLRPARAQERDHLARVALLHVRALGAVRLDGVGQQACAERQRTQIKLESGHIKCLLKGRTHGGFRVTYTRAERTHTHTTSIGAQWPFNAAFRKFAATVAADAD